MSEQTSEALRIWFRRVEPLYPELFNTAHVICGNYEQAEYALRSAILEVYLQTSEGGMGFRERLRSALRYEALQAARSGDGEGEYTWPGYDGAVDDPLVQLACQEDPEVQRLLMLRHGVGLAPGRIAQITGLSTRQIREALDHFELKARRFLPSQERSRFEAMFSKASRRQLNARAGIPQVSSVYRAFEAEAAQQQFPEHRITQVIYRLLVILMALICAAMFWLFAVLVQPPAIENPSASSAPPAGAHIETAYTTE